MEMEVGQNVLFSQFVGFLSRNCTAHFVSLCASAQQSHNHSHSCMPCGTGDGLLLLH